MKKQYLAIAFLAVALGLTACSSKKADTETTTVQAAESTTEASSEEEAEEEYYYGFVSLVEDKVITVSDDEGKTVKFDITDAILTDADAVGEGDEVNVGYTGEMSDDVTKATSVEIMTSAAEVAREEEADTEDLVVEGTIESADDSTITLKNDEGTYTLNALIAQKVTKDGIKAGATAEVTYYGDLEDTTDHAVATRIITEDAMDSEEAQKKTLTGTAAEVETDHIVLDTADPENTFFSFVGTEGMFDGINVGDKVTVIYDGTLTENRNIIRPKKYRPYKSENTPVWTFLFEKSSCQWNPSSKSSCSFYFVIS